MEARALVGERFEVLEVIGRGGMGVVYRARDRERRTDVALKTLRGITPESVLRFKSEFRALCDVRHPNLVELGELFENDGTWFFTMELVRGASFLDWVHAVASDLPSSRRSSPATPTPATGKTVLDGEDMATSVDTPTSVTTRVTPARERRIRRGEPACDVAKLRVALAGLARGLQTLHAAGKVHRDVKPSNVLVEDNGRVVLLDFGVVAELGKLRERAVFGTVRYMAPEQARGEAVDAAADWYAFGALLYQALTGELPFAEGSQDELLVLKQHVDPPPPSALVDGIPEELDRLTIALLDRDPSHRPNAAEIFEVLAVDTIAEIPRDDRSDDIFVGRQIELSRLQGSLEHSRRGAAVVIVEGESGVGKTSLVNRFVEVAHGLEKRVLVLRGRCHERERLPFNALDGVIDELARHLVRRPLASVERVVPTGSSALLAVFPALRMVQALADAAALERPVRDLRGTAFTALRELFVRLGKRRGVVLVIDDIQWADADSATLLAELVRPGDSPRLCVIATKRAAMTDTVTPQLASISAVVDTIELTGLDRGDAEELVRLVARDDSQATAIVAEAHGHPLFLRELARNPSEGSVRLEDAIRARADRHVQGARVLLDVVCVADSPIPRQLVAEVAGLSTSDTDAAISSLLADRLVRVHGPRPQDPIEPFHDRIRAAIYGSMPRHNQRTLHVAIATKLEALGAPPSVLLAHYDAIGDTQRSLQYLIAAADAARAAFAFSRAAELYRRAVDTPGVLGMRRATLLVQLADSLANDGRTAEAASRYLEAARLHPEDSAAHLDLLRKSAERYLMGGRVEDGLQTARKVLERAGMILPQTRVRAVAGILWNQVRMRGNALTWTRRPSDQRSLDADIAWSIGAGLGMIDSLLGAYFSGRAARLALREGSTLQIARGMAAATIGASLLGRKQRANRLMAAAEQAAREDGSTLAAWYVGLAEVGKTFVLDNNFKLAQERARALEAEWYAAGYGPSWETDVAMHFALSSQMMMGQHLTMVNRVNELVRGAVRSGDLFQEVTLRVRFALRHLLVDAPDVGRADIADALAAWLPGSDSFGNQRAWALWSRTRNELYAGQLNPPGHETEWKRMHSSLVGRLPMMKVEWLHAYATYLMGRALDAKRRGLHSEHLRFCRGAESVLERYKKLAVFQAVPTPAALVRAGVAWVRGDADLVERLRFATEIAEKQGIYAMVAGVRRRLGEALGGDEGAALVAKSELEHRSSGFVEPARAAEFAIPTGRFSQ